MELNDDLLMAIFLADNVMSKECVDLGWAEGSFEEDVTDDVRSAWLAAVRQATELWLERHGDKPDHPYMRYNRDWLKRTGG